MKYKFDAMASMSLDNQIKKYLPQLDSDEKKSILGVIKSFLKLKESSQPRERISIEQYNKEIEEAMTRTEADHYTAHEDVLKEADSW